MAGLGGVRRRGAWALVVSTALLVPGLGLTAPAQAAPAQAAPAQAAPTQASGPRTPGHLLAHRANGAKAIRLLGSRLPEAARRNNMSAPHLTALLRDDSTAWVDPAGRVYFVDRAPGATATSPATAAGATTPPPYPYDQTFQLHSSPGSNHTIYLDFDGQLVSGTAWNVAGVDQPGVDGTTPQPAFDLDDDPGTFSQHERDVVQDIWQRVSEDYAPFDVDVTTADPGDAALTRTSDSDLQFGTRALITPSKEARSKVCGGGSGGCAYLNVFDEVSSGSVDSFEPAWVFPQALLYDPKYIADAVSHEVGHTFGLEHDGATLLSYYQGHNGWGPIMGGPYDAPITQWSKGEYSGANNQQDDLAVISAGGAPVRADDHAGGTAGSTPLSGTDLLSGKGLITSAADKDVFSFTRTCAGPVTATVTPAPVGPDLDVGLRVLTGAGTVVAQVDPTSQAVDANRATGLDATWTGTIDTSTYYLEVDGVGRGADPTVGYSDYASVGAYSVQVTGCGKPAAPTEVTLTKSPSTNSATLAWQPPPAGGLPITGYAVTGPGGTTTVDAATRSRTFTGLTPGASYTVSVAATTSAGTGTAVRGASSTQPCHRPRRPG
jgi:hypothetical protein